MTRSEYSAYLASEHWQSTRKEILGTEDHSCERCAIPRWLARIAYDQDFHLHHKHYRTLGSESDADLEILCRRCHELETFARSEFREVLRYTCSLCKQWHWNSFSSTCGTCSSIIGCSQIEFPVCLAAESEDLDVWRHVLHDLYFFLCKHNLIRDAVDCISHFGHIVAPGQRETRV